MFKNQTNNQTDKKISAENGDIIITNVTSAEQAEQNQLHTVLDEPSTKVVSDKEEKIRAQKRMHALFDELSITEGLSAEQKKLRTSLFNASRNGDIPSMVKSISSGANIHWKEEDKADPDGDSLPGATALHYAAQTGQTKAVRLLLGLGSKIDQYDGRLLTPLFYAVDGNHLETVTLLLNQKADVNKKCTSREWTPLHSAAAGGGCIKSLKDLAENAPVKENFEAVQIFSDEKEDPNLKTTPNSPTGTEWTDMNMEDQKEPTNTKKLPPPWRSK